MMAFFSRKRRDGCFMSSDKGQTEVRRVGIAGFGTVGQSVARLLCSRKYPNLLLTHIYNRNIQAKKVDWVPGHVVWTDRVEDVLDTGVDIFVELIGGLSPAKEWIEAAIMSGKSVVTANKQVIA
jgi:homoserine dehydrogenase